MSYSFSNGAYSLVATRAAIKENNFKKALKELPKKASKIGDKKKYRKKSK